MNLDAYYEAMYRLRSAALNYASHTDKDQPTRTPGWNNLLDAAVAYADARKAFIEDMTRGHTP